MGRIESSQAFFGWRVAWAAFVVAIFAWGIAFYGPPVYMHALQAARGWSVSLVSSAITTHFLAGALAVANLPAIYARFGVVATTKAGVTLLAVGTLGWACAEAPWQLFAATLVSGMGWAMTGAVAINAFVTPWFYQRRPAALSLAYNGASVGGIVFPPMWVALIAWGGFPAAAAIVGSVAIVTIWLLASTCFAVTPESLGQQPDGAAAGQGAAQGPPKMNQPLHGSALWRSGSFVTYATGFSVALFAQAGVIAHLFSLLVPMIGERWSGMAMGLMTASAIGGRFLLGWGLRPHVDRRIAGAVALLVQAAGCVTFMLAGAQSTPLLVLAILLFGLGVGVAISIGPLIAQSEFAAVDTGRAIALATAISQAAYAFAPGVFGLVREWTGVSGAGAQIGASGQSGTTAFFVGAASLQILAAAIYLAGRRRIRNA